MGDQKKLLEDVIRPEFERGEFQRLAPKLFELEAQNPGVLPPGTAESLAAQYEGGALNFGEFVMAMEEAKMDVQENLEVVGRGTRELARMERMLGDPDSVAGAPGSEDGDEASSQFFRLQQLMQDPTPDPEEIDEAIRAFHLAAADPHVKQHMAMDAAQADAEIRVLRFEMERLQERLLQAQPEFPIADAEGVDLPQGDLLSGILSEEGTGNPHGNLMTVGSLDGSQREEVGQALNEWIFDPARDEESDAEIKKGLRNRARELGIRGSQQELEELVSGLASKPPKRTTEERLGTALGDSLDGGAL